LSKYHECKRDNKRQHFHTNSLRVDDQTMDWIAWHGFPSHTDYFGWFHPLLK